MNPQLSQDDKITVGLWLSAKKYADLSKRGLMTASSILKDRDVLAPAFTDISAITPENYPLIFERIDNTKTDWLTRQYDLICHKNTESMAQAFFFQIPEAIADFKDFTTLINNNPNAPVVDPLIALQRLTLDRCPQYNDLIKYFPIGENLAFKHNVDKRAEFFSDLPLWVCVPTQLLVNYTKKDQVVGEEEMSRNAQPFTLTKAAQEQLLADPNFQPKTLTYADSLLPHQIASYPLLFDQNGDGIQQTAGNELHPSLLCIKSTLACGAHTSHAMVLSHNAVVTDPDGAPNTFRPAPLFLPAQPQNVAQSPQLTEGLHVVTQVVPHEKVFKVFVLGDYCDVEARDSISMKEMYYTDEELGMKKLMCEEMIEEANILFTEKKYTTLTNADEKNAAYNQFRDNCEKIREKYNKLKQEQQQQQQQENKPKHLIPNTLYFHSRYMMMYKYTNNSYYNTHEHPSLAQYDDGLMHSTKEDIHEYLTNILNGNKQPFASFIHNDEENFNYIVAQKDAAEAQNALEQQENDVQFTLQQHVDFGAEKEPFEQLYLPSYNSYKHAYAETHMIDKSQAYKDHLQIGKLIQSLTFEHFNHSEVQSDKTTVISDDLRTTFKKIGKLLQEKLGMRLFGFDMVQNKYTGAMYLIDINYLPSYNKVVDFPARFNYELIQAYLETKKTKKTEKKD